MLFGFLLWRLVNHLPGAIWLVPAEIFVIPEMMLLLYVVIVVLDVIGSVTIWW